MKFTGRDMKRIDEAVLAELASWSPENRAKIDIVSFRSGFVAGLATSLTGLRVAARMRALASK